MYIANSGYLTGLKCLRAPFSFKRTLEYLFLTVYILRTGKLPSFKIATINQEALKDATSNFMDDFFLLQHYSPSALCIIVPFLCFIHPGFYLISTSDKTSLSVPSHLFMSADFSVFQCNIAQNGIS